MEEAFYQAAGFHASELDNLIRVGGAALVCIWCAWVFMASIKGMGSGKGASSKNIIFCCLGAIFATVMLLFLFGSNI